jgi:hypothetical protein
MNQEETSTANNNSKTGKVIRISPIDKQDYGFRFVPDDEPSVRFRLTRIHIMVAQKPLGKPNEIDLGQFVDKKVIVNGHFSGGIVYNATIN